MKFVEFTSLFESQPAHLAILSTFQLDADFFERQLLRRSALARGRRILVFMDAGQWFHLLRQDVPARFVNRRYLVVPVRPQRGVFHPKLNLLVSEQGGQIQCGSNNLTRSGCSSNLELLNSLSVRLEDGKDEPVRLAQEAIAFFLQACDDAEEQTGQIARQWIDEARQEIPWLGAPLPPSATRRIKLVHTYEGSLWQRVAALIDESPPKRLLVISPFHDRDAEMVKRVQARWPKCEIELVVQQRTTTLPLTLLKKFRGKLRLSELCNSSRRLHAKLLAWESKAGMTCLVGSANFTTAALDSRNVETCLLVTQSEGLVESLFDGDLRKRSISLDDFEPGTEQEPEPLDPSPAGLRLISAVLTKDGELRVAYQRRLAVRPTSLRLAIRTPCERRPRALVDLPNRENGTATVILPAMALVDAHATILGLLVAETEDGQQESPPVWVIQESHLTYERSGEGSSSTKSKVEETGEGLTEFLEELGRRDGVAAVIEYLQHLNIRFYDGGGVLPGQRKLRLRIRDPFHPDVAPEWLIEAKTNPEDLKTAISEFVERHERQRLRRHAKRGNINGMENFLDVLNALVRLLYVYYVREVVHRDRLIGWYCDFLELATKGIDTTNDYSEGYLHTTFDNLGGDFAYLQEVCDELDFLGHLYAVLVIVQKVRFVPGEVILGGKPVARHSECLAPMRDKLRGALTELRLTRPPKQHVMKALEEYNMFSPEEMVELEKEIVL